MRTNRFPIWLCILMLCSSLVKPNTLWAQEEVVADTSTQLEVGREVIEVEAPAEDQIDSKPDTAFIQNEFYLPSDSIEVLKRNGHYAYVPRVDSFLRAQKNEEKELTDLKPPTVPWWIKALVSTPAKMIYWGLAIGLVLFILYRLFFAEGNFLRRHKRSSVVLHDPEEEENPSSVNWNTRIQDAEQRGDYRTAIRYQHRYLLAQLHEQKWIVFTREKTNSQYLREAKAFPLHAEFVRVTRVFDHVWFGHAPLTAEGYTYWKSIYSSLQSHRS